MKAERGGRTRVKEAAGLIAVLVVGGPVAWNKAHAGREAPSPGPVMASASEPNGAPETAVFAGGCFWGVQLVFQHVKGVTHVTSGYSGGAAATAHYPLVGTGTTGHAESVEVTFDPAQVSYERLLEVFFSVAHDPTELNRQGPDTGTQYRSAVFYASEAQQRAAEAVIARLEQAKAYSQPIVTQVVPLKAFYPAEDYHQDYATLHPESPYIVINDAPKLEHLHQKFPELYSEG